LKLFEGSSRLKPEKERLEVENEELQDKIEKMKNDQLRQTSKLNKQINDITNERDLLEQELKTAEGNNAKLMERL
jgi:predicted Rossmann fold nucleotide-binding protein DprA/Smf involved in DNA uptake